MIRCVYDDIDLLKFPTSEFAIDDAGLVCIASHFPTQINYITPMLESHHERHLHVESYSTATFLVLIQKQMRFDEAFVQLSKPCRLLVRVA